MSDPGEVPLVFPAEHEEVHVWLASIRTFSRSMMALSGAVLAGIAQISERVQDDGAAGMAAVGAVVCTGLCILIGLYVERMVFAEAQNRFSLIFGAESFGGSRRIGKTWQLHHFARPPGVHGIVEAVHHTASLLAAKPQVARWLTFLQSGLWLGAASQYAFALVRILL